MTDLSLSLGLRTSGRSSIPVLAETVRELTPADLCLLDLDRGVKAPHLKRLRDHHHRIARLIAEGKRTNEISMMTGVSIGRISVYRSDPAMAELVSHYSKHVEEVLDDTFETGHRKMTALRDDLIEELHERLLETPEKFNEQDIMDGIKLTSDRTGLGPQSKTTSLNINMNLADRIAAGRIRASKVVQERLASPAPGEGGDPLPALASPAQEVLP